MNWTKLQTGILLVSLGVFFAACGAEEGGGGSVRTIPPPGPSGDSYNFNNVPSVSLGLRDVFAGNDVSFEVKFPDGYDSRCDESVPVLWRSIGDSTKFTIDNVNACRATVITTADFKGEGTIEGNMILPDLGLVRWTGSLKLMDANSISSNFTPIASSVWGMATAANELVSSDPAWFLKVDAVDPTPDSYYLRVTANSSLRCLYLPEFALTPVAKAAPRSFLIKNVYSKIRTVIQNDDQMDFSFECKPVAHADRAKDNRQYWASCPFEITREDDNVRFKFKTIADVTCGSSGTAATNKGPSLVNTFQSSTNPPSNYEYPVDLRLVVNHKRLKAGTGPSFPLTRMLLRLNI